MNTPVPLHPVEAQILARVDSTIIERARKVRLMAFDVDGVLTDGLLYYGEQGEVMKAFHVLDGHGLRLLKEGGVHVSLVTGRTSAILDRRAAELGINSVHQGVRDKVGLLQSLAHEFGLETEQLGYMGDDLIDLSAMQKAGFAASVPNAPQYITQAAHWVADRAGGAGAVRECCDLLLASQGRLAAFLTAQPLIMSGSLQ